MGLPAIVLASRLRPTSWSHAAAYHAFNGKWRKAACGVDWPGCDIDDPLRSLPERGGSGGDGVFVVRRRFADHEVQEEGDDHDPGGDVDAGRPAPRGVVQDPAHHRARHGADL